MFDSSANVADRLPSPFVEINEFQVSGLFGLNEWSTTLELGAFDFAVTEAKALIGMNATIPSAPLTVTTASEFLDMVKPANASIEVTASLDVSLPVFVVFEGESSHEVLQHTIISFFFLTLVCFIKGFGAGARLDYL